MRHYLVGSVPGRSPRRGVGGLSTDAKACQRENHEDGMAGYTRKAFAFNFEITCMLPNIARTGSSAGPRAESRKWPPTLVEGDLKSAFHQ